VRIETVTGHGLSLAGQPASGRLLVALARRHPDAELAAGALRDGADWTVLETAARHHRVLPLVAHAAATLPGVVPAQAARRLAAAAARMRLRAMAVAAVTVQITGALEAAGIPVLVLKGVADGVATWGDPTLRATADVDLFVPPAAVPAAADLLRQVGFRPVQPAVGPLLGGLLQSAADFVRAPGEPSIDLHWRFADPGSFFPLSPGPLLAAPLRVAVGGGLVPALPTPERFLYLCVHGALHGWTRLQWLCDVAELMSRADVGDAVHLAGRWRLQRAVAVACALAEAALGAPALPGLAPPTGAERRQAAVMLPRLLRPLDALERRGGRLAPEKLASDLFFAETPRRRLAVLASRLRPSAVDLQPAAYGVSPLWLVVRRVCRLLSPRGRAGAASPGDGGRAGSAR
jgi:hypothetical protein